MTIEIKIFWKPNSDLIVEKEWYDEYPSENEPDCFERQIEIDFAVSKFLKKAIDTFEIGFNILQKILFSCIPVYVQIKVSGNELNQIYSKFSSLPSTLPVINFSTEPREIIFSGENAIFILQNYKQIFGFSELSIQKPYQGVRTNPPPAKSP